MTMGAFLGAYAQTADPAWETYKDLFNKEYSDVGEEHERHAIFQASIKAMEMLNKLNGEPVLGWTYFTDRKKEEFPAKGYVSSSSPLSAPVLQGTTELSSPAVLDWRLTAAVTPVKNQGQCGCCWAFSAVETVESYYAIQQGLNYSQVFSTQQVCSCAVSISVPKQDGLPSWAGVFGCFGGQNTHAFEYLSNTSTPLASEYFWPYTQDLVPPACNEAKCTARCDDHHAHNLQKFASASPLYVGGHAYVSSWKYATKPCDFATTPDCGMQDLASLESALLEGPVSICLNAVMSVWGHYTGGVLKAKICPADTTDHCVQLVGYNKKASRPYYIVRNSWTHQWGMDGYIHLEYGKNTCGLANQAALPVLSPGGSAHHKVRMLAQASATAAASHVREQALLVV
jgi:hypothetical protein